jgi:hypothetical protein
MHSNNEYLGCNNKEESCAGENCACKVLISSDCVNNVNVDLTCSSILKGQTLSEVLTQLDAYICERFTSVENFVKLANIGTGVKIYKGTSNLGKKELKTLLDSSLINITEEADTITISVDEDALSTFAKTAGYQDTSGKVDKVAGKSLILDTEITKLNSITEILTTSLKTNYDTAYTWVTTNGANVLTSLSLKEDKTNKKTTLASPNDTDYPTTKLVADSITDGKVFGAGLVKVTDNQTLNTDVAVPFVTTNGSYESIYSNPFFTFNPIAKLLKLVNATFSGSVIVPNATLAGQAVNKSQLDLKSNTTDMSQVLTHRVTWLTGNSQVFTLPNAYYAIYAVSLNGQLMAEEEYSFTSVTQVTITPTLANGDYIRFLYGTNASANNAPYYTQAQTEAKEVVLRQDVVAKNSFIKSNESLSLAQRKGDVLYGILDQYTGEEITLSKFTGTPTVDNIIYFQLGSEYFIRNTNNVFNVKWFGVLGNGVADDSVLIKKCIDSVPNNSVIDFGNNSTYIIGVNGLLIDNRIGLTLVGNSTIKSTGVTALSVEAFGKTCIKFNNCTKCGIKNLTLNGNNIVQAMVGFVNCESEFLIDSTVFNSASTTAQILSAKSVNGLYTGNTVRDALGSTCRGMWIGNLSLAEQAKDLTVKNNKVYNNTATGIVFTSIGGNVSGNVSYSNLGSGIIFSGGNGLSSKNIVCNDNICELNLFYGIQSDVVYTTDLDLVQDVFVNNNICRKNSAGGILMTHSKRMAVTGNVCNDNNYDNSGNAGGIEADYAVYNAIISKNQCSETRTGASRTQTIGIRIVPQTGTSTASDIVVEGNICDNNLLHGIQVEPVGATTAKNIIISSNICNNNSSRGIFLAESTTGSITATVVNNRCINNTSQDLRVSALNVLISNNVFVTQLDVRFWDFPALATTPTVGARMLFRANNTSATTISNFLSAREGQEISILGANGNTTIEQGLIQLKGVVNVILPNNGTITLIYQGSVWREKSRSF